MQCLKEISPVLYDIRMKLGDYNYGERPLALAGCITTFEWIETIKYLYFGECSLSSPKERFGKGMQIMKSGNELNECWFNN